MRRALLTIGIVLLFSIGCASTSPLSSNEYTLRPYGMTPRQFANLALEMVEQRVPEWDPGTIYVKLDLTCEDKLGSAWVDEKGVRHLQLCYQALILSTVEDLASVVLHEFVHLSKWDEIEKMNLDPEDAEVEWCTIAVHELWANRIVIENFPKLRYSPQMMALAQDLYWEYRVMARNHCAPELYRSFPYRPQPISD